MNSTKSFHQYIVKYNSYFFFCLRGRGNKVNNSLDPGLREPDAGSLSTKKRTAITDEGLKAVAAACPLLLELRTSRSKITNEGAWL